MVAIFTGLGSGLERGSGSVLGSAGLLGSSTLGRGGENVFVNAATGNLMISQQDEFLVGLGPDAAITRTYNSLGDLSDENGDNWRFMSDRKVFGLSGTVNTAGSTVHRMSADGSDIAYNWDAGQSAYIATDGAGAYDKLTYNSSTSVWTWTDGDTQVTETYSAFGANNWVLSTQRDTDGNTVSFDHVNGTSLINRVITADGSYVQYNWSGNNLTSIVTGYTDLATSTAKTLTRTSYTYDNNRLATVTVDLSPEDNSTADGKVYTTTYTYVSSSSKLVSSISQSDGSRIDITYDGSNRVQSITQTTATGVNRTTSLAYAAGYTTITDPYNQTVRLDYDASDNLTKITMPPAGGGAAAQVTQFAYNSSGDVTSVTDALNNATTYANFVNGLAGTITDRLGNITTRTFDSKNRVVTETTTSSDAASSAASHTTRYVYDSENHLKYLISAEGNVTWFSYTAAGLNWTVNEWAERFYDVSGLSPTTALTEAQMDSWSVATTDNTQFKLTEKGYDARGNLQQFSQYSLNVPGGMNSTESFTRTVTTYDQAGNLLNRFQDGRGMETFVYDGLGRMVSAVDLNGGTTSYVFDDANSKTIVTFANGLVQTSTFNKAGERIAFLETAGAPIQLVTNGDASSGTTGWTAVNATASVVNGALRVTNTGANYGYIYQAISCVVGKSYTVTIDEVGSNNGGQVLAVDSAPQNLANATSGSTLTFTATASTMYVALYAGGNVAGNYSDYDRVSILTQASSGSSLAAASGTSTDAYDKLGRLRWEIDATGKKSYFLYDNVGRKVADVSSAGDIIEYRYDSNDRIVATIRYGTRLTSAQIASLDNLSAFIDIATVRPALDDQHDLWTWRVYDKEGRLLQAIDGLGWTTTYEYDGAGRLIKSTTYYNNIATSLVTGFKTTPPTTVTLPTADAAHDAITRNFYNKDGRLLGTLDGEGFVTKCIYDNAGYKIDEIAYANASLVADRASGTFNTILSHITADAANDRHTRYVYNGQGQLRFVIDSTYHVTEMRYATGDGQATTTIRYANAISSSTTDFTWDNLDALVAAGGFASPTSDRTSYSVYDWSGRLAYAVDAEGGVTKFSYNTSGQVTKATRFAVVRSTTSLPDQATMDSWATANASGTNDRTTRNYYDGAGVLRYVVDGEGFVTRRTEDAEGRLTLVERFPNSAVATVTDSTTIDTLHSWVVASGGTAATTTNIYDYLGRLDTVIDGEGVTRRNDYAASGVIGRILVAEGTADESITAYTYDGAGRLVYESRAVGTPDQAQTHYTYDGFGNVLTITDPDNHVTTQTYDRLGQMLTSTNALSGVTSYVYNSFGEVVQTTDPNNNVSFNYYDALGRLVKSCDALKYVTETAYNTFGEVLTVTRRYNAATNTPSITVQPTVTADPAHDAVTTFTYDRLGQVKTVTDAQGYNEQYTLNAFGNRTTVINKLGGTITNVYDRRGLLVSETLPMASVNSAGTQVAATVTNKFAYDARGNRTQMIEAFGLAEARTTNYAYDKIDRLVTKTGDAVTTVAYNDFTSTTAVTVTTTSNVVPTESYVYDRRGNLIQVTDANGAKTFSYYDKLNRKTGEVGPLGTLRAWTYDAAGNMLTERVYGDFVALPASPGGTPPGPINPNYYRETVYAYDVLNRLSTSSVGLPTYGTYNGAGGVTTGSGTATSSIAYDADGNVITATDANGGIVYSYYDKLGHKTAQLDAEGYLTSWTYDSEGNVLSERRYATKWTGSVTTSAPPAVAQDATNDRVTNFTYDRNGHRLTETRTGVVAWTVSSSNGALTAAGTSSTVTYTYNGLGQVLTKAEATGDTTTYTYDQTGRLTREQGAVFTDYNGNNVQKYINNYYNGLNNLSRVEANAVRVFTYTYGAGGRLLSTTDPAGAVHSYDYDAAGNQVRDSYTRTKSDATTVNEAILYRRDLLGRVVTQTIATNNAGTWTRGDSQNTQYDAWGGVAQRGVNGLWQEQFTYNNRGLVEKTNTGDGVWRFYVYDKNGNQVLAIESEGKDYSAATLATALTDVGATANAYATTIGVNATITVYDKRNQAIQVRLPQRETTAQDSALTTIVSSQTYNAFGEVATQTDPIPNAQDSNNPAVTTFTYNTMGRLIQKVMPKVNVTSSAGVTTLVNPTENYYYDLSGRQVATQDANNSTNSQIYLAGTGYGGSQGLVTNVFHPDGGIAKTFYDVFGDARTVRDELNRDETRTYDAMGRVATIVRRTGLKEEFTYDLLGQQTKHVLKDTVNTVLGTETSDYDLQGRVTKTVDQAGDTTTYAYAWQASLTNSGMSGATVIGGWTTTTTMWQQLGSSLWKTKSETADVHGLTTAQTDLGGHTIAFTYDRAGRLTQKVGTSGAIVTTLTNTFYNTSLTATVVDGTTGLTANSITSTFKYDAMGRRTAEKYTGTVYKSLSDTSYNSLTSSTQTLQDATITYDALGRMTLFSNKNAAAVVDMTIYQYYDAAGNIRRTQTTYPNLVAGGSGSSDKWFAYDTMNRMTLVDGVSGTSRGTSGQGANLTYNVVGDRLSATRSIQVYDQELHRYFTESAGEVYTYDADHQLATMTGSGENWSSSTTTRDIRGRVTEYVEYAGTTLSNHRWNIVYNTRGQVSSESNFQWISGGTDINASITNSYDNYGNMTYTHAVNVNLKDTWQDWTIGWYDSAVNTHSNYDRDYFGSNNLYTTDEYYDGLGRLQRAKIVDGKPRDVHFALNADNEVVTSVQNDGTSNDPQAVHRFISGKQVAEYTNDKNEDTRDYDYNTLIGDKISSASGSGRFYHGSTTGTSGGEFGTSGYDPTNQITAGVSQNSRSRYTVQAGDTLQGIAASLWGDSSLWYKLAEANGLSADSALTAGQALSIPLKGPSNRNNADMFRPYDPSSAVGDLNPTSAKPPKKNKCGVFGQILLAVIQVAVTVALSFTPVGPVGAAMIGDVVKQGVGLATGIQTGGFSFKELAMTGLTAAVTAGIGPGGAFGANGLFGSVSSSVVRAGLTTATASAISQGIGVATGLQKKFDWVGVAAAGVGAGLSAAVSKSLIGRTNINGQAIDASGNVHAATIWNSANGIGNIAASSAANLIANATTRSVIQGSDFGDNLLAGLPDVIASTLGGMLENRLKGLDAFNGQKQLPEIVIAAARVGTGEGVANQPTVGEGGGQVGGSSLLDPSLLEPFNLGPDISKSLTGGLSSLAGIANELFGIQPAEAATLSGLESEPVPVDDEFTRSTQEFLDSLPRDPLAPLPPAAARAEFDPAHSDLQANPASEGPNGEIVITAKRIHRSAQARTGVLGLTDLIANGEGSTDAKARRHGLASAYDVTLGYGKYAHPSKPVSKMTLAEVDRLQTQMLNNPDNTWNASPVGKYQIVRKTLRRLRADLGLGDNLVFTPQLQDQLAMELLKGRGLEAYQTGKISATKFQWNIANEWASVANPYTGRPIRAGQHLGTTTAQIQAIIATIPRKR